LSKSKQLLLVCALGHFLLILAVCSRDTFSAVARGYTALPAALRPFSREAEEVLSFALGEQLSSSNPVRGTLNLYLRSAGIEAGYGFFAPNVPDNYKLVFELHYPGGRVEYELPGAANVAAGLRLSTLIDNIGNTPYDPLREVLVKMMAYSVWREHPDAIMIRAVLGFILLPSPAELKRGIKESYQTIRAYDFVFAESKDTR
jgi:hypothetical protein